MKILKYSIVLSLFFFMSSCNDFLDVNTNPTKVSENDVNVDVLLPSIITNTSSAHYSTAYYAARATHNIDGVGNDEYYTKFYMSGAWSTIYLSNLNNIEILITKANEESSPHFTGVAKILKAVNVGLLTDSWEDVPFTEALQGSGNISPAYDKQEFLYGQIQSILDEAIADLEQAENFRDIGKGDFVYGGDVAKWIALAHSLKARYMLHLSNKSGVNWANILAEAELGIGSNDGDFQLFYTTNVTNPWFNSVSKKIQEVIYTVTYGKYFMDDLNGANYNVVDPRISILAELTDKEGEYTGAATYLDSAKFNVLPTVNTFYMTPTSPVVMMSFAELKFIEAEAALNSGDNSKAYDSYLAGIRANMENLGVQADTIDTYLADPSVATGTADLEHIMKEKYITLILSTESWNDMRRHNFSSDVYKNFVIPDFNDRDTPGQRAVYPNSEATRNKDNYNKNLKDFTTKMWKDQ